MCDGAKNLIACFVTAIDVADFSFFIDDDSSGHGIDVVQTAGFALGIAAANICVALGPRRIVVGGGVAQAGDLLLEPMRRTLRERVTVMPVEQVEVVQSVLGGNAGAIGMACWAARL